MKFVVPFATVLIVDQGLKAFANVSLRLNESWDLVPGVARFGRVLNRGMAWGYRADAPPDYLFNYLFTIPLLLLFAVIAIYAVQRRHSVGFGLLIAGGISNLITQWHCGGVVDTLLVRTVGSHYLPLNVADIGISIGAALVLIAQCRPESRASLPVAPPIQR